MSDHLTFWIVGILLLFGGMSALVIARRRQQRDLREYLEPALRERGLTFISAVHPGIFKVGPFPKIEVERGRPQTKVGGVRGEYGANMARIGLSVSTILKERSFVCGRSLSLRCSGSGGFAGAPSGKIHYHRVSCPF